MNEMKVAADKHMVEIERLLKKIKTQAKYSVKGAEMNCNWGHVGDLAHLHKALSEAAREVQ